MCLHAKGLQCITEMQTLLESSSHPQSHTVQATFFLALSVAGQLGTATLAAHQVVAQLWLLPAYIVDAFAVAGTVLGSRIAANIEQEDAIR